MAEDGIAPTSQVFQTCANLSQLFSHKISSGTERTRTVIVFIDSEVHQPFCHSPEWILDFGFRIWDLENINS